MPTKVEELLSRLRTTKEVADRYGVTISDVQYAIKRGHIQAYKLGGYFWVIHEDDLPKTWPTRQE
jgi:excisionase family DNA binding protein